MRPINAFLLLLLATLLLGTSLPADARKPKSRGIWLLLTVKDEGSQIDLTVKRTITVIENRCRQLGMYCRVQQQREEANQLGVRVVTRMNPERVKKILLANGVEVRPVVSPPFPMPLLDYPSREEAAATGVGQNTLAFIDRDTYLLAEQVVILSGNDLKECLAVVSRESLGSYGVNCRLRPRGSARLKAWTSGNINRYIAVVFNQVAYSVAYVKAPIWSDFEVWGNFDKEQARDLAIIFQSGNLPAAVELLEESMYKP